MSPEKKVNEIESQNAVIARIMVLDTIEQAWSDRDQMKTVCKTFEQLKGEEGEKLAVNAVGKYCGAEEDLELDWRVKVISERNGGLDIDAGEIRRFAILFFQEFLDISQIYQVALVESLLEEEGCSLVHRVAVHNQKIITSDS